MLLKNALVVGTIAASVALAAAHPAKAHHETARSWHGVHWGWHGHDWHRPTGDPYAYRPVSRGYYPYYNSHYWVSRHELRRPEKLTLPRYHPSWGYPRGGRNHPHDGYHHRWHW